MGQLFDILKKAADAVLREDWDEYAMYYSADVIAWSPSYDLHDRQALVDSIKAQNGPFDDVRQEMTLIAETDSTVVVEWEWSIPHPNDVERRAALPGLSYFTFEAGRIVKLRQYWDMAGFMSQFTADIDVG